MADTHRDVESVVQNVVNSPQFRTLVADVIESSNQTTNLTQTTSSNISPSQTISTNVQVAGTSTTTASTSNSRSRTTYANPIAEFNAIFRRGASTGQQQQGGGTVASFLPGIAHYTARSRSRNGSTTRTSRGRRSSSASSAPSKSKANNAFTREVVLLSSPTASNVVKGKKKAELLRKGQVISSFDFYRSWTKEDVYQQLSMAFQDKLHGKRYVRVTYSKLVNTVYAIFNSLEYFCINPSAIKVIKHRGGQRSSTCVSIRNGGKMSAETIEVNTPKEEGLV